MILLVGLAYKLVKWALIVLTYLLIGLAKLVAIVVVLVFFGIRAAIRAVCGNRDDQDDRVSDPYEGLHDLEHRSHSVSQDRFDPVWQQERDRRVAATRLPRSTGRSTAVPRDDWVRH